MVSYVPLATVFDTAGVADVCKAHTEELTLLTWVTRFQQNFQQNYISKTTQKTQNKAKKIQTLEKGVSAPMPTRTYHPGQGEQGRNPQQSAWVFGVPTHFLLAAVVQVLVY